MSQALAAIRHLERVTVDAGGAVLRYGGLYGSPDDAQLELVRARRFPIVGDDGGVTSFVHLDDAASATVLALEAGATGVFNVSTTSRPRRAVAPAARGHDRRQAPPADPAVARPPGHRRRGHRAPDLAPGLRRLLRQRVTVPDVSQGLSLGHVRLGLSRPRT